MGILSVSGVLIVSIISFSIASWCYDQGNFTEDLNRYYSGLEAVIFVDILTFISSIIGLIIFLKPLPNLAHFYCITMVLLSVFKIIAGSLWYSGVDYEGKKYNTFMSEQYTSCKSNDSCSDIIIAWETERGMEFASIILITILGLFSAISSLKLNEK